MGKLSKKKEAHERNRPYNFGRTTKESTKSHLEIESDNIKSKRTHNQQQNLHKKSSEKSNSKKKMQPQTDGEPTIQNKIDLVSDKKTNPKVSLKDDEPLVMIDKNGVNEEKEQQNGENSENGEKNEKIENNENGEKEENGINEEENENGIKEQNEDEKNKTLENFQNTNQHKKLTIPLIRIDGANLNESDSEKTLDDDSSSKLNDDGSDQSVSNVEPTPDITPVSTPTLKTRRSARLLQDSFTSYTEEMEQEEEEEEEDEIEEAEQKEKEEVIIEEVEQDEEEEEEVENIEEIEVEKPPEQKIDKPMEDIRFQKYTMPVISARRPLRSCEPDFMLKYKKAYSNSLSESMITHDGYTDDSDITITHKRKADCSPETSTGINKRARFLSSPGFFSKISSPFKFFTKSIYSPNKEEKKIEIGTELKEECIQEELEDIDLKCPESKAAPSTSTSTTPSSPTSTPNKGKYCTVM